MDASHLFENFELISLRQQVVALWSGSFGLSKPEIAFRLNLSVPQLDYIYPLQPEVAKNAEALAALYFRGKSGDGEAILLLLAATMWDVSPFSELLAMPDGMGSS